MNHNDPIDATVIGVTDLANANPEITNSILGAMRVETYDIPGGERGTASARDLDGTYTVLAGVVRYFSVNDGKWCYTEYPESPSVMGGQSVCSESLETVLVAELNYRRRKCREYFDHSLNGLRRFNGMIEAAIQEVGGPEAR